MSEQNKNRKFIDSIQILRLIAAFFVILVHCEITLSGAFAPDMFFVISGFIIFYTTDNESKIKGFLPKRFIRLVPLYWIITIFTYCILLVKPQLSIMSEPTPEYLIKSLCFIPFVNSKGINFPIACIGWTLNYEILFYILFFVSILISFKYRFWIVSAITLCLFYLGKIFRANNFYLAYWSDSVILDFIFGTCTYFIIFKFEKILFSKIGKFFCVIIFIASWIWILGSFGNGIERGFRYGFPSALIFLSSYVLFIDFKFPKFLILIGNMSYSVYFIEYFTTAVYKLFRTNSIFMNVILFILMLIVTYLISWYSYILIEKKLSEKLNYFIVKK